MFNNNLLMGAASAGGTSLVEVGNSALFTGSTPNLQITNGTPTSTTKWSFSLWFYRGSNYTTGANQVLISDDDSNYWALNMSDVDKLEVWWDGSSNEYKSEQVFRDVGWYHCVVATDTSQATVSNRLKVYINGERITMTITNSAVSQNETANIGTDGGKIMVGSLTSGGPRLGFQGYFSEFCFIDGTQSVPSDFGQYDSTGTFWTPKSAAEITALTFGNNGFYLPFSNSSDVGEDFSGNNNDLTNNNTVVTDTHTPTNIEFLMSPINVTDPSDNPVLTNGNRTWSASSSSAQTRMGGNIPFPSSGKWIAGVIITELSDGKAFGIWSDRTDGDGFPSVGGFSGWHRTSVLVAYESDGSTVLSDTNWPQGTTQAVGDQCWIAVDIDNSKTFFGYYDLSADAILWYANDAGNDGNPATGDNPFEENFNCAGMVWAGAAQNSKSFTLVKEADCPFTIPTGYSFLNTTNLAANITRTHSNLEEYFDTTLYEGNGAGQRVGKFLPFTDTFTVGNSGLFKLVSTSQNTSNPRLTRTQDAGASNKKFSFSFWYKRGQLGSSRQTIWNNDPTATASIRFDAAGTIAFEQGYAVGAASSVTTTRVFTDTSQWYNVIIVIDTTQATASDRQTIYVNGVSQTLTIATQLAQNADTSVGGADSIAIGSFIASSSPSLPFDGYLAEFVYVNNQVLSPSDVGQVDTSTGRWIPKTLGGLSFGSTDYYLNFATLGEDVSGNNNDFTNANVLQSSDTPTVNFATFDPNRASASATATIGNTRATVANSQAEIMLTTLPFDGTGKFYVEIHCVSGFNDGGGSGGMVGFADPKTIALSSATRAYAQSNSAGMGYYYFDGNKYINAAGSAYGSTFTNSDVIGVYVNGNNIYFTKNNTLQNSASEAEVVAGTPTNAFYTDMGGYCLSILGAGGNNPVADIKVSSDDWTHTPFSGFGELSQDNLTTGESYQTAFSWIKNRDATDNHMLFDRVRGIYKDVHSNEAAAEVTNVNTLQRFLNGGVQVGNDVQVNTANESYVAWNWYMEATGSGSSNTDGTINTTSTLVDTNLGMSISTYSGTGGNATVGHGLGVTPQLILIRGLENTEHWQGFHVDVGPTRSVHLNTASSGGVTSIWFNNTAPTSSVFSLGTAGGLNSSGLDYVAYCFAPSQFISIGSYEGNLNANGTFIPTVNSLGIPIQPVWWLHKCFDTNLNWYILDSVSQTYNVLGPQVLSPDTNEAAPSTTATYREADFVTGGVKIRGAGDQINNSNTHIYMAIGTPIIDVDGRIITGR